MLGCGFLMYGFWGRGRGGVTLGGGGVVFFFLYGLQGRGRMMVVDGFGVIYFSRYVVCGR